jgi:hypothetical protein
MSSRVILPHPRLRARMSEEAFQQWVIDFARLRGWRYYHTRYSKRSPSGFPDLVLVRNGRLIFAELKTETGRVTTDQQDWIDDLDDVTPLLGVYVWRPSDMEEIAEVLK